LGGSEAGWTLQDRDDMNLAAASPSPSASSSSTVATATSTTCCSSTASRRRLRGEAGRHGAHRRRAPGEEVRRRHPACPRGALQPLPFAYLSTGEETLFINHFDPHPRTRRVFSFHRPDTLREWLTADTLDAWLKRSGGFYTAADDTKPSTLRARLRAMPPVDLPGMWPNKVQAVANVEKSLFDDRPRSLIQMATGSGKTLLAVTTLYRLIKFGGARRVLFLVDRANLGEQAEKEFQGFRTPDDNRLFTELYGVQRLTSNTIGSSSKVVISTIQRLYSILKGEPELDPEAEEHSDLDGGPGARRSRCRSSTTPPCRRSSSTSSSSTSATGRSTRSGARCWSTSTRT
jgi:type I restriction enzyme, R subunit